MIRSFEVALAIVCRYFGGMSVEEVAEALSVSPATLARDWGRKSGYASRYNLKGHMQAERWHRIEDIFQSVIDCMPDQRSACLDSACGTDAELRREVESLLAWNGKSGFTNSSALDEGMSSLEPRRESIKEERRIGAYRVLREIGRDGMGTVYLAARADDEFQKLVAIKIIRGGLDSDDIIERFRSERQILATLDHPNITRLLVPSLALAIANFCPAAARADQLIVP